jgi:hypothetical protein
VQRRLAAFPGLSVSAAARPPAEAIGVDPHPQPRPSWATLASNRDCDDGVCKYSTGAYGRNKQSYEWPAPLPCAHAKCPGGHPCLMFNSPDRRANTCQDFLSSISQMVGSGSANFGVQAQMRHKFSMRTKFQAYSQSTGTRWKDVCLCEKMILFAPNRFQLS